MNEIANELALEEELSRPSPALIRDVKQLTSPLVILGAGGKMGPTLCLLAKRAEAAAGHPLRVIAVSRFRDAAARASLERGGVEIQQADLFDRAELAKLPDAENILYLVGLKFGTSQNPGLTWAANTIIPANVIERYPKARVVALSTGNVYPLVPVSEGGAREDHPLTPLGEYANAAVARERVFEWAAQRHGTALVLVRLNYAVELRYGVLRELAERIWRAEEIDLTTGHFNCLWQRDANEAVLRMIPLAANPPLPLNLTGPVVETRRVAEEMGALLGKEPKFAGQPSANALVSNPQACWDRLGQPITPWEQVLRWTAAWVKAGGKSWNKPTHFETRDGKY